MSRSTRRQSATRLAEVAEMLRRAVLSLLPVGAAFAVAACGSASHPAAIAVGAAAQHTPAQPARPAASPGEPSGTVITVRNSSYGQILADGADRTIYLFTRDRSTTSMCYGACASAWPPVLSNGTPRPAPGLTRHLGTTRRRDGHLQVTYKATRSITTWGTSSAARSCARTSKSTAARGSSCRAAEGPSGDRGVGDSCRSFDLDG